MGAPVPLHHLRYGPGQPLCDEHSKLVLTVPSVASMVVVLSGDNSLVWGVQSIPILGSPSISARSSPELVDIIDEGILRVERVALPLLLHAPPEEVCGGEPGELPLGIELSEDDSVYYHVWVF